MRIVNQTLPADRGPGLLEIHPHDQNQGIAHLVGQCAQALRIVTSRGDIVNGTRPYHYKHPVIPMVEDVLHGLAGGEHRGGGGFSHRQLPLDLFGGGQYVQSGDIDVIEQIRRHGNSGGQDG